MIVITDHICQRYIERFNPQLASIVDDNMRLIRAKSGIMSILNDARYVSDDDRGILLHSQMHHCNLIIRMGRLITLYHPNQKNKERDKKYKHSNNDDSNSRHFKKDRKPWKNY